MPKTNQQVCLIGETLIDLVKQTDNSFRFYAGGSIFNSALTLGKFGISTYLITPISNDYFGKFILAKLKCSNIVLDNIFTSSRGKTSLAFAFKDEQCNAEYSFYKDEIDIPISFIKPELFIKSQLFHFGSYFALSQQNYILVDHCLSLAKKFNCIISYDPNFRKNHLPLLPEIRKRIENYLYLSDIVKGSIEDFQNIFNVFNYQEAIDLLKGYDIKLIIITLGANGAVAYSDGKEIFVPANIVQVVDTIGAGDNFTSGMIRALTKFSFSRAVEFRNKKFSYSEFSDILNTANYWAGICCQNYGAEIDDKYFSINDIDITHK